MEGVHVVSFLFLFRCKLQSEIHILAACVLKQNNCIIGLACLFGIAPCELCLAVFKQLNSNGLSKVLFLCGKEFVTEILEL